MNRKPIFDAVRVLLGRGFAAAEIKALDDACDLAEAAVEPIPPKIPAMSKRIVAPQASPVVHVLGGLSEEYESSGRGPGTVSGGRNDPGGVSYGVYQFASKAGTCTAFVKGEGRPWATDWAGNPPGSDAFSEAWQAVAKRDPKGFRAAQHSFIERTHYRPVVAAIVQRKGLELDARCDALRDVIWSCAVQHRGAPNIVIQAIDVADRSINRAAPDYDRKLIEAIYAARIAYVRGVAANGKLSAGERAQLLSITQNRYPKELAKALALYDSTPAPTAAVPLKLAGAASERPQVAKAPAPLPLVSINADTIDGNEVAAANGVDVKNSGVKIAKLDARMGPVIVAIADVARSLGLPRPVITSGNDSGHMTGSLHFKNRALDFRGNNLKISVGQRLAADVATRLGAGYDVIFETFANPARNHLHVEYDPK
ncbi:VgrG-related protein [Sphingomonas psychrotolerans]|uniref:Type VI secretion system spike protein VgrG3-like C-terminal domain-containing protein n=1 Tax=Sphingomonas psychrotolerans TaxID=1327635 RepID=A0A2K8MF73_9SPHN|nr:hypothetical protein [Sphingomonas psychrotolerans]ATY32525.1 hypothetical protein CVN68_11520 [Sphingomonas psychrotolerans]